MSLEVLLYISEVSDSIRIFLLAIGWVTFIITLCIMFSKSCELETGIHKALKHCLEYITKQNFDITI